jgi:protein-disulfide isomerase
MPRRPAKVTQADIARAIRAAKHAGANEVTVDNAGTIRISLGALATPTVVVDDREQSWAPSEALSRYLKRSESG